MKFGAKLIIFLDKILNLYLYFIIGACVLSWVPNINPDYPLFHYWFVGAGFYIVPPILGVSFSPVIAMIVAGAMSMGLRKLYDKFYKKDEPKIVVMTPEEFMQKMIEDKREDKKDDSN